MFRTGNTSSSPPATSAAGAILRKALPHVPRIFWQCSFPSSTHHHHHHQHSSSSSLIRHGESRMLPLIAAAFQVQSSRRASSSSDDSSSNSESNTHHHLEVSSDDLHLLVTRAAAASDWSRALCILSSAVSLGSIPTWKTYVSAVESAASAGGWEAALVCVTRLSHSQRSLASLCRLAAPMIAQGGGGGGGGHQSLMFLRRVAEEAADGVHCDTDALDAHGVKVSLERCLASTSASAECWNEALRLFPLLWSVGAVDARNTELLLSVVLNAAAATMKSREQKAINQVQQRHSEENSQWLAAARLCWLHTTPMQTALSDATLTRAMSYLCDRGDGQWQTALRLMLKSDSLPPPKQQQQQQILVDNSSGGGDKKLIAAYALAHSSSLWVAALSVCWAHVAKLQMASSSEISLSSSASSSSTTTPQFYRLFSKLLHRLEPDLATKFARQWLDEMTKVCCDGDGGDSCVHAASAALDARVTFPAACWKAALNCVSQRVLQQKTIHHHSHLLSTTLLVAELLARGTPSEASAAFPGLQRDMVSVADQVFDTLNSPLFNEIKHLPMQLPKEEDNVEELQQLFVSATPARLLLSSFEIPSVGSSSNISSDNKKKLVTSITPSEILIFALLSYTARFSSLSHSFCDPEVGGYLLRRFGKSFTSSARLRAAFLYHWCVSADNSSSNSEQSLTASKNLLDQFFYLASYDFDSATDNLSLHPHEIAVRAFVLRTLAESGALRPLQEDGNAAAVEVSAARAQRMVMLMEKIMAETSLDTALFGSSEKEQVRSLFFACAVSHRGRPEVAAKAVEMVEQKMDKMVAKSSGDKRQAVSWLVGTLRMVESVAFAEGNLHAAWLARSTIKKHAGGYTKGLQAVVESLFDSSTAAARSLDESLAKKIHDSAIYRQTAAPVSLALLRFLILEHSDAAPQLVLSTVCDIASAPRSDNIGKTSALMRRFFSASTRNTDSFAALVTRNVVSELETHHALQQRHMAKADSPGALTTVQRVFERTVFAEWFPSEFVSRIVTDVVFDSLSLLRRHSNTSIVSGALLAQLLDLYCSWVRNTRGGDGAGQRSAATVSAIAASLAKFAASINATNAALAPQWLLVAPLLVDVVRRRVQLVTASVGGSGCGLSNADVLQVLMHGGLMMDTLSASSSSNKIEAPVERTLTRMSRVFADIVAAVDSGREDEDQRGLAAVLSSGGDDLSEQQQVLLKFRRWAEFEKKSSSSSSSINTKEEATPSHSASSSLGTARAVLSSPNARTSPNAFNRSWISVALSSGSNWQTTLALLSTVPSTNLPPITASRTMQFLASSSATWTVACSALAWAAAAAGGDKKQKQSYLASGSIVPRSIEMCVERMADAGKLVECSRLLNTTVATNDSDDNSGAAATTQRELVGVMLPLLMRAASNVKEQDADVFRAAVAELNVFAARCADRRIATVLEAIQQEISCRIELAAVAAPVRSVPENQQQQQQDETIPQQQKQRQSSHSTTATHYPKDSIRATFWSESRKAALVPFAEFLHKNIGSTSREQNFRVFQMVAERAFPDGSVDARSLDYVWHRQNFATRDHLLRVAASQKKVTETIEQLGGMEAAAAVFAARPELVQLERKMVAVLNDGAVAGGGGGGGRDVRQQTKAVDSEWRQFFASIKELRATPCGGDLVACRRLLKELRPRIRMIASEDMPTVGGKIVSLKQHQTTAATASQHPISASSLAVVERLLKFAIRQQIENSGDERASQSLNTSLGEYAKIAPSWQHALGAIEEMVRDVMPGGGGSKTAKKVVRKGVAATKAAKRKDPAAMTALAFWKQALKMSG